MSRILFSSDTHIGHRNIIEYCQRPFKDLDEMHSEIIRRWNMVVSDNDTVYHLGDLALCPKTVWQPITQQLKGHKILIRGNHDKHTNRSYYDGGFEKLHDRWDLKLPTEEANKFVIVFLEHRPQFDYDTNKYSLHLCGHVHTRWTRKGNIINVGVDKWSYAPVTIEELIQAKEDYKEPNHAVLDKGYYE